MRKCMEYEMKMKNERQKTLEEGKARDRKIGKDQTDVKKDKAKKKGRR